jgi:hypothetical protein
LKRVITEFKSAPHEVLQLISKQYPFGYDESHLVNFMNPGSSVEKVFDEMDSNPEDLEEEIQAD